VELLTVAGFCATSRAGAIKSRGAWRDPALSEVCTLRECCQARKEGRSNPVPADEQQVDDRFVPLGASVSDRRSPFLYCIPNVISERSFLCP